jgi:type I restriction enzyme M protein
MAIKKSELYSSLWKSCDELRGGMDASQYKDYILVLLFIKYVSDKYGNQVDAPVIVPNGGSFQDMVALKGKPDIGDGINKIISKLAEANDLKGVIDIADFNDSDKLGKGKEMQDRLSNLVAIFQNEGLDFSKNKTEGDDILGDAYEYLMRNFATESGKSKGQFYTPAEVSRVIAEVVGMGNAQRKDQTLYDPACGSGSLLLKAANEAPSGITIYGQEMDGATRALAVMNMWLHGNPEAEIWRDNTISSPHFKNSEDGLKTFDFAVANPPFSSKSWSNGIDPVHDIYGRFDGFGIPPKKNGDYAFLLHMIKSLKSTGKGAMVLPHGVLFRGNAEAEIRKNLIKRGYIKAIIGLPPNLFYGTGIPASIIIIDKESAEYRKGIFIIDASRGFYKDGNKNRLRERDIHKIVDVFTKQAEVPKYSRMVSLSEIADERNDYNLNISRYVDSREEEERQDIEAHLKGDIPVADIDFLNSYWKAFPNMKKNLFSPSKREGYLVLNVDISKIASVITDHPEFRVYSQAIEKTFLEWKRKILPIVNEMGMRTKPKELILRISESILETFKQIGLIDNYDVYQLLMTYWLETMQDDAYIIATSGWKAEVFSTKDKNEKETGWDCDLVPKNLVIDKYFQSERDKLAALRSDFENASQELANLDEENEGEDDLLSEARNEMGKVTKPGIMKRLDKIGSDPEFADESNALRDYETLVDRLAQFRKRVRDDEKELDRNLLTKYLHLTEDEVRQLVIEEKWLRSIQVLLREEVDRISQKLASRIRELAERYEKPLSVLLQTVQELTKKVDGHLERMGFQW